MKNKSKTHKIDVYEMEKEKLFVWWSAMVL